MTLISEIKKSAMDRNCRVSDLLRMMLVLSHELNSDDMRNWVEYELNGYPKDKDLPSYRIHGVESRGNFVASFGRQLSNAPIPMATIREDIRKNFLDYKFRDPIAYIEDLLENKGDKGSLQANWPADVVSLVGQGIYEDFNCLAAWMTISRGSMVSTLDTVRNKILQTVLDLQRSTPGLDAMVERQSITPGGQMASNIVFNTNIYGTVGNLGQGSSVVIRDSDVAINDWESLERKLIDVRVPLEDRTELKSALDESVGQDGKITARLGRWIGGMIVKAGEQAIGVQLDAAAVYFTSMVNSYLGIR